MAQDKKDAVGGPDTAYAKGNWSNRQLKKDAARGMEVPRTDTKAHYRDDMAGQDYYNDLWARKRKIPGFDRTGKTPKRYYDNFDRGAARDAAKSKKRASGRKKYGRQ